MGEDSWKMSDMFFELTAFADSGVDLYLDGKESDPARIAAACCMVREQFMRDYVTDETGVIEEIRFQHIE